MSRGSTPRQLRLCQRLRAEGEIAFRCPGSSRMNHRARLEAWPTRVIRRRAVTTIAMRWLGATGSPRLATVRLDRVALITECAECGRRWLPDAEDRWQVHLGVDEDLDETAELFFYCLACAEPEFD
jgi:hypothetical protein